MTLKTANPTMNVDQERKPVLVTGASGYSGGRLVSRLLAAGHRVRLFPFHHDTGR